MTKEERIQAKAKLLIEKVANLSYRDLQDRILQLEAELGMARAQQRLYHSIHSGDHKDD